MDLEGIMLREDRKRQTQYDFTKKENKHIHKYREQTRLLEGRGTWGWTKEIKRFNLP